MINIKYVRNREFERSNYVLNIIVVCCRGGLLVPVIEISVLLYCRLVFDFVGFEGIEIVVVGLLLFDKVVDDVRVRLCLRQLLELFLCCNSKDFCSSFCSRFHSACATS